MRMACENVREDTIVNDTSAERLQRQLVKIVEGISKDCTATACYKPGWWKRKTKS